MLEFLWSGSNKPTRAEPGQARRTGTPPADRPDAVVDNGPSFVEGLPSSPPSSPRQDGGNIAGCDPARGSRELVLCLGCPRSGRPPACRRPARRRPARRRPARGADLPGADLPGADLPGADLPGADLPGADLPAALASAGRRGTQRGRRLVKPAEPAAPLSAQQRLLLLDTWRRSGLPAGDFAALVGVSKHTLYAWKKKFDSKGPAGLMDQPRGGPRGSRLSDLTKRTILMLKQANPDWGCQRISDMLLRGPALPASRLGGRQGLARGRLRDGGGATPAASRQGPPLRAGQAQSTLANRPVHVYPEAAKSTGLPGRLHGRSQPLHRRLRAARQPVVGPGARGVAGGADVVRHAARRS